MKPPEPHVLVVDDDPSIRRLTRVVFASEGFDVATVGDGIEALRAISTCDSPFDALVTDIQMPNLDGWGLMSALRTNGITIPTVVISATEAGPTGQLKVDSFLAKPFDPYELVREVRRVLSSPPGSADR